MTLVLQNLLILFSQCIVIGVLLILLLRLRKIFGLSLLFTTLGVFQYFQVFLAASIFIEISPYITISPGSMVMFTGSIFAILFVFIREDANEARKVIYALFIANLVLALLLYLFSWSLKFDNIINIYQLPINFFTQKLQNLLIGTFILLLDAFLIIFIYEMISARISNLFLRILLSTILLLIIDSVIFSLFLHGFSKPMIQFMVSGIISKSAAALLYTVLFTAYLKFLGNDFTKRTSQIPFEDLFHTLTYKQKFEAMRMETMIQKSKLQKSEKYNRLLFDSTPIGMALIDREGYFNDVNLAFIKLVGRKEADLLNLKLRDITPTKYTESEIKVFEDLFNKGGSKAYNKEL